MTIINDVVDQTIFSLLTAIDQGQLRLRFQSESGVDVDLAEDGLAELGGSFMGEWRRTYATTKVIDDFADMRGT